MRDRTDTAARAASLALVLATALVLALPAPRAELLAGVDALRAGDLDALRAQGARLGPRAALFTTALMVAQALAAPLPALLVTWVNAWLFGPLAGGLLSILQGTLAAGCTWALGRALGAPVVARLVGPGAGRRWSELVRRHGWRAVLVARLLPVVPFDPVGYAAGALGMAARPFLLATLAGQTPAGLAYAYLGQSIDRPARLLVAAGVTLLALSLAGIWVARALRVQSSPPPDG